MKRKVLLVVAALYLLPIFPVGAGAAETKDAISQIKLTQESLPSGMKITKEIWASDKQLQGVRRKVGFPIAVLLNQTLIYGDERAQVNYLLLYNESWLVFGYSTLIRISGSKSFIFLKGNVLVQLGATTKELQSTVAHLLKPDPLFFVKIGRSYLPEDWDLAEELCYSKDQISGFEREFNVRIGSAIVQKLLINHTAAEIKYYNCGTRRMAETFAERVAQEKKALYKTLVECAGPIVVVVVSQDVEINAEAMTLVNWHEVPGAPVVPN